MSDYSTDYFLEQRGGSLRSARTVLPVVFELVGPKSVVDVGCGVGPWLAAARELGAEEILGIDGEHVDKTLLMIPSEAFQAANLNAPIVSRKQFDLAICVEVAEHLPESSSRALVKSLTSLAPVVLFSAAIPGQTGAGHVNLQWPPYWETLFLDFGFVLVDCVRWQVWNRPEVEVWYAQNCLLFVSRDRLAASPKLSAERDRRLGLPGNVVHPTMYDAARDWAALTPRVLLRLMPASFKRTVLRRWSLARESILGSKDEKQRSHSQ
jgi:SAM-dependent methyltransferase